MSTEKNLTHSVTTWQARMDACLDTIQYLKAPVSTILVPRPQGTGFPVRPVAGVALLEWARGVIDDVIDVPAPASATTKE